MYYMGVETKFASINTTFDNRYLLQIFYTTQVQLK